MKNERKVTVDLMTYLGARLHGATLQKHSDRFTSGRPDLSVTHSGTTWWIENKRQKKGESLKKINHTEQLICCHELAVSSHGRCWVSIYSDDPKTLTIYQPRVLMAKLWPKIILGELPMEPTLISMDDPKLHVFNALQATGAIKVLGWNHELQRRLILGSL